MDLKPGYQTSELQALAASAIVSILNKKLGLDIDPMVLVGLFGAVGAYAMARGWVKKAAA